MSDSSFVVRGAGTGTLAAAAMAGGAAALPLARSGWIVSPWFDLAFFANVYWVLALVPFASSPDGEPYFQFWMAYFLATPHRWLTLVVAATDRDRRYGQTWLFVALAVVAALATGGAYWATGDFRLLGLVYTIVLGWHFAAQHGNILTLYAAESGGAPAWQRPLAMLFLLYVVGRMVPFLEPSLRWGAFSVLATVDLAALAIPLVLVVAALGRLSAANVGTLAYMASVLGLWSAVLWAAHEHNVARASLLLGAVTMVHSVEYLALVSHYAARRRAGGSAGLFQKMAGHWATIFVWYVVGCGLLYSLGNAVTVLACFAVNMWASLVHCAYDGLMWRLREPATAQVFGLPQPAVATVGCCDEQ